MKIVLPIYASTTKNKTVLMSLNWYRNAHFGIKDKVKKHYHEVVFRQLRETRTAFENNIRVKYQLYYKRGDCDLMNVVSILDKFLLDALVMAKVIKDDNVKKYVECHAEVGGQDKENPRLVCIIEEK